jgi:hypothetical protein
MILRAMNVNARPSGNLWNHDGAAGTKVGHRSGKSTVPLTWATPLDIRHRIHRAARERREKAAFAVHHSPMAFPMPAICRFLGTVTVGEVPSGHSTET